MAQRFLTLNFDDRGGARLPILTDESMSTITTKIRNALANNGPVLMNAGPSPACINALECPICLEQYGPEDRRPTSFPCGHSICIGCMRELRNNECPTCRAQIVKAIQQPAVSLMQVAEACGGHNFNGGKRRRRRRTTKNRSASRRRRNSRRARR